MLHYLYYSENVQVRKSLYYLPADTSCFMRIGKKVLIIRMYQHAKIDPSSYFILKFSGGSKFKEKLHYIIVALLCSKEQRSRT